MDIFAPIQQLADVATYQWLNLTQENYTAKAINFFIYDVIKIGILLILINYLMAITRYFFPMEKVKNILTKKRFYGLDYLLAALLGVITPFCSCSSIPLFIGFLSAGIPLGIIFTFLISSPLINESSLYLFPAIFGLKATLLYNLIGVLISVAGGMIIQKLKMEKYIQPEFLQFKSKKQIITEHKTKISLKNLLKYWAIETLSLTKKIYLYVLLGVALGALIHGYVPENLISKYLTVKSWWGIPLATIMGTPLYASSVSVIPVIEALVAKGIPMGSALAFMTSTVALSLPEALMLKKVMKWQLLTLFFAITIFGIMVLGYLFNFWF